MEKIYHTKVQTKTVCKNGSERFGAQATALFGAAPGRLFEISMFGKNRVEAESKLLDFMSDHGVVELEEIEVEEEVVS